MQVRAVIAMRGGIQSVVSLMRSMAGEPALLCNACLCLMSLVRGEGPTCEVRQCQLPVYLGEDCCFAADMCFSKLQDIACDQLLWRTRHVLRAAQTPWV